ncbi:MAG: ATP-binding cassette domain-containing protein [Blastochloris sp.]|nr:ATP-binding cassette domain-containing protein [Blastochloris sp.]
MSLRVEGVTVTYPNGHTALKDASFSLEAGSICAMVGVNGSGKSTLFKSIMGFVEPQKGSVRIAGLGVKEACRANGVAYVPQSEEVDWSFPVLVRDVVMMGRYGHMNALRISRRADREAVRQALKRVGLLELQERQIGELSGGQKKRVFLARALAQEAKLILLDEPFTGVDVTTEHTIIGLLRELREAGHIILVSTHNLGSVPEFCDQVVLINRRILAQGTTSEVFTAENLLQAFGGKLRHFRLDDAPGSNPLVLTDDERPLVLGHGGKVEDKGDPSES